MAGRSTPSRIIQTLQSEIKLCVGCGAPCRRLRLHEGNRCKSRQQQIIGIIFFNDLH